jgi:type IV pilus biogenesis protein CpaD/CtpE
MSEANGVQGGNEDDQSQLNTLRGEIGAVAGQLDRLVNEISNEWALQSAFLAKERAALVSFGAGATSTATAIGAAQPATAAMLAAAPFVTIKFDRSNVSYRNALAQAVSQAKARKPNASFDVVGVTAGRASTPEAAARAQEVANTLSTLGVDTGKIRLFNAAVASLQAPEVRIYAR